MRLNMRNSGFERGNIEFWRVHTMGALEIETTETYSGSYAGKITTHDVMLEGGIAHDDLFEVEGGRILNYRLMVKGVAGDSARIMVVRYDKNGDELGAVELKRMVMSGDWESIHTQYPIDNEVSYISMFILIVSALGSAICYIDNAVASVVSANEVLMGIEEIGDIVNATTSGDTSADLYRMLGFMEYYAEIDVAAITGTNPTCDVTICEEDQYYNERVLGTFTQFNAITDQRVGIAKPTGYGMYVKYVMGGTVTDCDFKVSVIGVR